MLKKLLSAVMAVSMVFGIVSTAAAAPGGNDFQQAFDFMKGLGCVQGYTDGQAHLDDTLTRAQAVTILVNCTGNAANAKILAGAPAFPDSGSHWASGAVAVAKNMGWVGGFPDGKFHPDEKVTYGQLIQMLDNALGLQTNAALGWPERAIKAAVDAGFLPADANLLAYADGFAPRGAAFLYANVAFMTVPLASGKTIYQTYLKSSAPTVDATAAASTTVEKTVAISGTAKGASAVTVGGTAATLNADGSFSATVNLKVGVNEIKVVATDVVNNSSNKTVTVTRTNTAANSITVDSESLEVVAGGTATIKASVLDTNGAAIADATVTGKVEGGIGTFDAATGTFTADAKAGTGTITLSTGSLTKVVTVTVKSGVLTKIVVVPATALVGSGSQQTFTATGADANGNPVAITGVQWSSDKGVIDPATGVFAGTTTGTATVYAKVGALTGTSAVTVYGKAVAVKLSTPEAMVANGASKTTVTATAVDASGNVDPSFNGDVTFTSTDNINFALSAGTATAVNGVATITVKSGTLADAAAVLQASAVGLSGSNANLATVAQKLTSFSASQDYNTIPGDHLSFITVTLTAQDQAGQRMIAGQMPSVTAKLAVGAGFSLAGGVDSQGNLAISLTDTNFTVVSDLVGTASASVTGSITTSSYTGVAVPAVTVASAPVTQPYKVVINSIDQAKSGAAQEVTVVIEDAAGNAVTNPGNMADITLKSDAGSLSSGSTQTQDPGSAKVTFTNVATAAGTVTYTATGKWNNQALQSATATGTIVANAADHLKVSASPATANGSVMLPADGVTTATLTVKVVDLNGNPVSTGSYKIGVVQGGTAATKSIGSNVTLTTVGGLATLTVTSKAHASGLATDTFTFADNGGVLVGIAKNVSSDNLGVASQIQNVVVSTGTINAGEAFSLKADVQDANSHALAADQGRAATLTIKDDAGTTVGTYNATSVNGVLSFSNIVLTKRLTGTYTYGISSTGLTGISAGTALGNVLPGTATALKVTSDLANLTTGQGQATVTLKTVDAYGNSVPMPQNTVIKVANSNHNSADLGDDLDGNLVTGAVTAVPGVWTYTVDFPFGLSAIHVPLNALGFSGTSTLTATASGFTSGSTSINVVQTGPVVKTSVTVDGTVAADNSEVQTVTVLFLDEQGRVNTGYNKTITALPGQDNVNLSLTDNGSGTSLDNSPSTVVQGKAEWTFVSSKAETVTYTVHTPFLSQASNTAKGTFVAAAATKLAFSVAPYAIKGNGSQITAVTVKAVDANDNAVTTATGTVNLVLSDTNYAYFQGAKADGSIDVTLSNGQGVAIVQAKNTTNNVYESIQNATYTLPGAISAIDFGTAGLGNAVPSALNLFAVGAGNDSAAPTVTAAMYNIGAQTVTLTFSETMNQTLVTLANFSTRFHINGTTTQGTVDALTWNGTFDSLTVHFSTLPTGFNPVNTPANSINAVAGAVKDLAGNAVATTPKVFSN